MKRQKQDFSSWLEPDRSILAKNFLKINPFENLRFLGFTGRTYLMLYLIATPIGNLEDITDRARRILGEVDFVLAEDTRHTGILLKSLAIEKKLISFHEHTNLQKIDWVISELKSGKNIAFVSDAGTPNLSDPGGKLVESALKSGLEISPVPGPSALTTLISVAPFSCSKFQFLGYFPKKKGREKMTEYVKNQDMPIFFYESPYRILKTLEFLAKRLPNYDILIGRELTKKFEQILFIGLQDKKSFETILPKGEFVFALIRQT